MSFPTKSASSGWARSSPRRCRMRCGGGIASRWRCPAVAALPLGRRQQPHYAGVLRSRRWRRRLGATHWLPLPPTRIVAPPKVLRWLAERGRLPARAHFQRRRSARSARPRDHRGRPRGTGCGRSTWRPKACSASPARTARCIWPRMSSLRMGATRSRRARCVAPMVTDFTRRAQAMIRYRMNDLLGARRRPLRLRIGAATRRRDCRRGMTILLIADGAARQRMVTPDICPQRRRRRRPRDPRLPHRTDCHGCH